MTNYAYGIQSYSWWPVPAPGLIPLAFLMYYLSNADDTSSESEYSRQSSYSPIHEPSPAAAVLLHDTSPAAAVLLHEPSPAAGVLLHDTSPSISRVVLTDDEATGKQKLKDQEKKERSEFISNYKMLSEFKYYI